ncbi:FAD-dependent monooxygenase [uncultured Friedmanniella sp.]|uniref:FAD-dependent monooxygenase n=1 Tax=uncultured Friedmanniella sp. TaxID=335381 RepID=UPI0035CA6C9B
MPAASDPPAVPTGRRVVDVVRFPTDEPPEIVDVLVVGAGPAGLGTAVELERHGVSVAVVDGATQASLVRAGAMGHSARVVELFRRWGLLQRIRDEWTIPPEWDRGHLVLTSLAGHELAGTRHRSFTSDPRGVRGGTETGIRRPQTVLQKVFLERLAERGVAVAGGWRATGLAEDADRVVLTVEHTQTGRTRKIHSRYLVGADGGRSFVRRAAGIERDGAYATERHFRFVVRTRSDTSAVLGPQPSGTNVIVNETYAGFLAALDETHWRAYAGPYALGEQPTEEELRALGRSAFGFDVDLDVVSATPYFKSTRIAQAFRRGRVLLVGDAAHVRTPGGNLGEGFGDIANLGWKLAATLRGDAGEALLDSYDAERRPHNWRVADHALQRAEAAEQAVRRIRAGGVPADDDTSEAADARRVEIGRLLDGEGPTPGVTFDERYDASPVVAYEPGQHQADPPWSPFAYAPTGAPGHRAPNGYIDPYGGTLYDRLGSHLALLVLGQDQAAVAPFLTAARERGIELEVIHLADADARAVYGRDYALVRPDLHVAWRGEGTVAGSESEAGALLDLVYGRVPAAADDLAPVQRELAGVGSADR